MREDLGFALHSLGSPVPLGGRQTEASFFIWFEGTGQSRPLGQYLPTQGEGAGAPHRRGVITTPCGHRVPPARVEQRGRRRSPGRPPRAPHTARSRGGEGRVSQW